MVLKKVGVVALTLGLGFGLAATGCGGDDDSAGSALDQATAGVESGVTVAANAVGETVNEVVGGAGDEAIAGAQQMAEDAGDAVVEMGDSAMDAVSEAGDSATAEMDAAVDSADDAMDAAASDLEDAKSGLTEGLRY